MSSVELTVATLATDACWIATEGLGALVGVVGGQRSPILLGPGSDGRLTLRSHCSVPSSTPIAGLYILHTFFGKLLCVIVLLCPSLDIYIYIYYLLIIVRALDHLLSPELVAGRLTWLSPWADHANLASGVWKRDIAAGEHRSIEVDSLWRSSSWRTGWYWT